MKLRLEPATLDDAPAIAALHAAVAERLTQEFGRGHWSNGASERAVLLAFRRSRVLVARQRSRVIATLILSTRKPWAIDRSCFGACVRPLYLTNMAVAPDRQRRGLGRQCVEEARRVAREWPSDAIRLDAYDAAAGAGGFYAKCGFREVGRATYRGVPLIYFELPIEPELSGVAPPSRRTSSPARPKPRRRSAPNA